MTTPVSCSGKGGADVSFLHTDDPIGWTRLHIVHVNVAVRATRGQPPSAGAESEGEQRFCVIRENFLAFTRRRIPDSCRCILSARGDKFVFVFLAFIARAPLHMYEFRRVSATHHASS